MNKHTKKEEGRKFVGKKVRHQFIFIINTTVRGAGDMQSAKYGQHHRPYPKPANQQKCNCVKCANRPWNTYNISVKVSSAT